MEFSEKKALDLKNKFDIPNATIVTWRHRGKIPDKYFKEGFSNKTPGTADKQLSKDILKALASDKINNTALSELSGVNRSRIADFKRGRGNLSSQEMILIKKNINKIRLETKIIIGLLEKPGNLEYSSLKKIESYFSGKSIYPFKIIGSDRLVWAKLEGWLSGKRYFPYEIRKNLLQGLLVFAAETSI